MIHLIRNGLAFANLFHVASPALVDRYNRALEHLTGKRTTLTDFHIDISGFSPEVGDELGDMDYLNPGGCNRQFILLSTRQKTAPLLEMKFSTSRDILRAFIEANEGQLFVLTAQDAVAGELVNSVYTVEDARRLLDIRRVTVEADTTKGTVAKARKLAGMADRVRHEPDAWWDDVLIGQMIGLAKQTGDIHRAPIVLSEPTFEQFDFWSAHFGGLYVFRGTAKPQIIAASDLPKGLDGITLSNRNRVARWLKEADLVEPVIKARGIDGAAVLRAKMDFILVETAAQSGAPLEVGDARSMRALARRHARDLPPEFHTLDRLVRWAEGQGEWPRINSEDPAYFYTLRAKAGPQAALVNMLLADLCPHDIRQLFICHKPAFYAAYAGWSENKRAWVAEYLASTYVTDKAGTRAALFAHVPEETAPEPEDLVAVVGPWGAVPGRRG